MRFVERRFRQIDPPPDPEGQIPRTLSCHFARSAIVVLGDPGAGKTTAFAEAAAAEPNAVRVPVRDFLALSPERWRGSTLYLDGLDEERAKAPDGRTTIDILRARLEGLGCPPFRLSCRAADWYGSSDTDRLRMVAPGNEVVVLQILPLAEEDIRSIVREEQLDADSFMENARTAGVQELLANPQTLSMLLEVVKVGAWPQSRAELFERATELLAREVNDEHLRSQPVGVADKDVREAAAAIAVIVLCGGAAGVALSRPAADSTWPFVGDFPGDSAALQFAARTRLFRSAAPERVQPVHRSVAESLAAAYLAHRIAAGLPLGRVLALLTGYDGGTLSDLRGVYAWLSTRSTEHAEGLVRGDPLGVVLYGDAGQLSPSAKRVALHALAALAERNPWFRSEDWTAQPFGALATPEMEPTFKQILRDRLSHPVLLSCTLDALRYGQPLPGLATDVMEVARTADHPAFIRVAAAKAFRHIAPDRESELQTLLIDIHERRIEDPERELKGFLLAALYPARIGPAAVVEYLVEPHPSVFGEDQLLARTRPEDLPAMLDAIVSQRSFSSGQRRHVWQRFIGRVLSQALQAYGETVTTDRLFRWLGVAVDDYGAPAIDEERAKNIQRWFEDHPSIVRSLFQHWLVHTDVARLRIESLYFWRRLQGTQSQVRCGQWLLELAAAETEPDRADFLFREAVQLRTGRNRADAPSIDELYAFVDRHPRFMAALRSEMSWDIADWQREQAEYRQRHIRERRSARISLVASLEQHLDGIRSGLSTGRLEHLLRSGSVFSSTLTTRRLRASVSAPRPMTRSPRLL